MDRYYMIEDGQGTYYLVETKTHRILEHICGISNFITVCATQYGMKARVLNTLFSARKRNVNPI